MFPDIVFHKLKEARGFLQIIRGKLSGDDLERLKGVERALESLEEERETYRQELAEAREALHLRMIQEGQDDRSDRQDISAI
jgi:hypothetical protein